MPTPEQILAGLGEIANGWRSLAIAWHVYLAALLLGFAVGWRPSRRLVGVALALPLLSVSALAWLSGNPFNGALFAVCGVALLAIAARLPAEAVHIARPWLALPGGLMFAFGWGYPHFLAAPSWLPYLYAAPTGLIPCPTLSASIGLTLVLGGLASRAWSLALAAAGVFYGVFGAVRLGVTIDWVLALGALLLAAAMRSRRYRPSPS